MTGQTLSTGQTIASKYGAFGISNKWMIAPPDRSFVFLVGESNSGKTNLVASNPAALILNLDGSSTPMPSPDSPPPPAQFFPGINEEGQTIGADGQPLTLTWGVIEATKKRLIEAATSNQPRPRMVVLDSVGVAMNLIKQHLVDKERAKPGKEWVMDWTNLHGEAAWEALYGILMKFKTDLSPYYGVWFTGHIASKWRKLEGKEDLVERKELSLPPGFMPRFYPLFEAVLGIESKIEMMEVTKVRKIKRGDTVIESPHQVQEPVRKVYMSGQISGTPNAIHKRRIKLPLQLELPATGGWDFFAGEYKKAATATVDSDSPKE